MLNGCAASVDGNSHFMVHRIIKFRKNIIRLKRKNKQINDMLKVQSKQYKWTNHQFGTFLLNRRTKDSKNERLQKDFLTLALENDSWNRLYKKNYQNYVFKKKASRGMAHNSLASIQHHQQNMVETTWRYAAANSMTDNVIVHTSSRWCLFSSHYSAKHKHLYSSRLYTFNFCQKRKKKISLL